MFKLVYFYLSPLLLIVFLVVVILFVVVVVLYKGTLSGWRAECSFMWDVECTYFRYLRIFVSLQSKRDCQCL